MKVVLAALTVIAVAVSAVHTDYEPLVQTRLDSEDIKHVYHSDGPDKLKDTSPAWGKPSFDAFVINGTPVTSVDQFPQTATLLISQIDLISNAAIQCSASVIDAQVVLTAAHCVQTILANWQTYSVCAGTVDLGNDTNQQCSEASDIWVPAQYDDDRYWLGYDIAIIKVKSSLLVGGIQRAKVNFKKPANGLPAFIVGFGYTVANGGTDGKMYYTDAFVRLNEEGQCSYNAGSSDEGNTKLICGIGANGISGSCNGDSGGPLLVKKRMAKNYVVVGVVSFGERGCNPSFEGVYASLYDPAHKRFIKKMVRRAGGSWKRGKLPALG